MFKTQKCQLHTAAKLSNLTNTQSTARYTVAANMDRESSDIMTHILSEYTPCDISDSLVKHGYPTGGFIPNLTLRVPVSNSIVGKAYTVLYAPKDDPRPEVPQSYIDQVPGNSVLVVGLTKDLQKLSYPFTKINNALYGGLMSTRLNYLKCNGTIVLGNIRDVQEHRDLNYPVMSYGVGTTAPKPLLKVIGINVPIEVLIDGYPKEYVEIINPGDFIVADENGCVRLPYVGVEDELFNSILRYIPQRKRADELVASDIKLGEEAVKSQKLRRGEIPEN